MKRTHLFNKSCKTNTDFEKRHLRTVSRSTNVCQMFPEFPGHSHNWSNAANFAGTLSTDNLTDRPEMTFFKNCISVGSLAWLFSKFEIQIASNSMDQSMNLSTRWDNKLENIKNSINLLVEKSQEFAISTTRIEGKFEIGPSLDWTFHALLYNFVFCCRLLLATRYRLVGREQN